MSILSANYYNKFVVLLNCLCLVYGCDRCTLNSQIYFPQTVKRCFEVEVSNVSIGVDEVPKLVFFYDSTECSSCVISSVSRHQEFLTRLDTAIKVFFLFAPPQADIKHVERMIAIQDVSIPFYVDDHNQFASLNRIVRKGRKHHYLLLDSSNHILDTGTPDDVIYDPEYVMKINDIVSRE